MTLCTGRPYSPSHPTTLMILSMYVLTVENDGDDLKTSYSGQTLGRPQSC